MKIFKELESLGFFDWMAEKGFPRGFTPEILDSQPYDSIERTGYNSIVIRWFREKLEIHAEYIPDDQTKEWYIIKYFLILPEDFERLGPFNSYEESSFELIKRLIEIIKEK